MINRRSKMHRTTSKGVKWLREHGYLVDIVPHTRYHLDLFGIADAVAIKDGEVLFVQFKTNSFGSIRLYREFAMKHLVNVVVMMYKDRKKEPCIRRFTRL